MDDHQENMLAKVCLDHASVCVFRLDQDGRIVYVNRKACDSLGYSQTDLLNMSIFDIDPIANREIWPSMWQKLCTDGSNSFESQHRRKDGTFFPIEVTVTLIEFEGRRYSMALTKDISERKRLYESLRITQFIFENAPLGIFLIKDGGNIIRTFPYKNIPAMMLAFPNISSYIRYAYHMMAVFSYVEIA